MNVPHALMIVGVVASVLYGIVAGVIAMKEKSTPRRQRLLVLCVCALYMSIFLCLQVTGILRWKLAGVLLLPVGIASIWIFKKS